MRNMKLLFKIIVLNVIIYLSIFMYISDDKSNRIKILLNNQIENLKTHYKLTTHGFNNTADATVGIIENDKEILSILTKFLSATQEEKAVLRNRLYSKLEVYYEALKKQGVLQMHFLLPNNVTSFRMHKPSKFGDDLTDFKYSFRHANKYQVPMSGLERGRTSPSYRNVRPLYGENHIFVGIVDIGFAPEILQKNLRDFNKIYSHFIIKAELLKERKWQRNDVKKGLDNDYVLSIENDTYLEFANKEDGKDKEITPILQGHKQEIKDKMSKHESFSLYHTIHNTTKIVSFLPLKNMKNETIAYLVSYNDSDMLYKTLKDFVLVNIVLVFGLILLSLFMYKIIMRNKELKHEKNKYVKLSQYDTLTKLPNRTLFFDRLKQSILKGERHKTKFALLFIDLDNFKHINDSCGHNQGDNVLYNVAKKLSTILRKEDTLARVGGDEFILIVENILDTKSLIFIPDKIIELLKEPIIIANVKYYIGASIGISIYPDDSNNFNDLVKFADLAMYKAKNSGKNNFKFYSTSMSKMINERIELENELRDAIKNEDFVVYYQPQMDGNNDALVGMEALVRWKHPTLGIVPPSKFIPLAEETGLIIKLDQIVMNIAMKQFSLWYKAGYNPGRLAINLAIKQLQQKDFINILSDIIHDNLFQTKWLELEVTESQIMTDPEMGISVLNKLSILGIELAVDDFGTGYSSLSYLKRLPINKLKIDKSFVDNLPEDEEDVGIAKAIISLSKSLNLNVIAEGVETKEQKLFLLENGCKNIQGYLYSKPLPAQEMEELFLS